ncbi:putative chloroperoxidase [Mycena pura]|uniref:Chloroperoxidase n=1 Tax=Mycena pura TaxID=153505 RepID=A0AAD6XVN3_9AGAR|nr:putative chloroperoxidase [Mycena pura]
MLFTNILYDIYIFTWDAWLSFVNLFAPSRRIGGVVQQGNPGAGGKWPEFVPPKDGDSRCACPALNAMANHDGRNVKFTEITEKVHQTFNFAETFSRLVIGVGAEMLHKNYNTDTFDLADLDVHNGIEHDASLLRQDANFEPDQGKPYLPFIHDLLASATGKDADGKPCLTPADISRFSSKRRAHSRQKNPKFALENKHKIFGSANASTLLAIFGGAVADLEPFLTEERIPEGWEPKHRSHMGLTFMAFNPTTFVVEMGIDEEPFTNPPTAIFLGALGRAVASFVVTNGK